MAKINHRAILSIIFFQIPLCPALSGPRQAGSRHRPDTAHGDPGHSPENLRAYLGLYARNTSDGENRGLKKTAETLRLIAHITRVKSYTVHATL